MMRAVLDKFSANDLFEAGVLLRCPSCGCLVALQCLQCGFRFERCDGIVHALPAQRARHYERFVREYSRIRQAEGRGSGDDAYYLGLPYVDLAGTNSRQWQIRARSFDCLRSLMLTWFPGKRSARVLDIGAGNCWLSFRLALAGHHPFAVDLSIGARDGLRAAEHYRTSLPELFPRFRAEMDHLPFQDEQFDLAVFNASFHYSENYEDTLREGLRCLRPGGMVAIVDTPWYSREESGRRMLDERRAAFLCKYGTASDSIDHLEFLTDKRLRDLEERFSIAWQVYTPKYGLRWVMRPVIAKLLCRREPSRFRIYAARKQK